MSYCISRNPVLNLIYHGQNADRVTLHPAAYRNIVRPGILESRAPKPLNFKEIACHFLRFGLIYMEYQSE
jgi:hypothetical protein